MLRDEPLNAAAQRLLVPRENHDEISRRLEAGALEADEVGDEDGVAHLVVRGPAAVEVAVLLEKGERIDRPIRPARRDDVHVREDDDRLPAGPGSPVARHEVAVLRVGADEHLDVRSRESGGQEPSGHGAGRARRVAERIGRIDLDELAEDVARQRSIGRRGLRLGAPRHWNGGERRAPHSDDRALHPTLAIASISTRTALGKAAACTVERAGLWAPKCLAYTSFIAGKSAMSSR